jgi:NADPH:quinone reductase-like Zn-dependent oxidoreductase
MKAAIYGGPLDITVGERADPVLKSPTDAIVRVTLACVCGSDLWYYRGLSPHDLGAIGHEFIGIVDEVGADVRDLRPGDLVVTPFLADILAGEINPGRVFDFETDLDHVVEGYQAMDERRAIKSLVRVAAE